MTQDPNVDSRLWKDLQRYSDSQSAFELPLARGRYEYLYARRDALHDKVRTGVLLLNAASLTGVLTALGNPVIAEGKFGLSVSVLAFCAGCFLTGLISGAVGFWLESVRMQEELGTQYDRMSRQMRFRAALDERVTPASSKRIEECMNDVQALPSKDFEYSAPAIAGTQFAGSIWIAGLSVIIWNIAGLIEWC